MGNKTPYHSAGLRPVCTLNPETVLEMDENGFCWVKEVVKQSKLFTEDELFELSLCPPSSEITVTYIKLRRAAS